MKITTDKNTIVLTPEVSFDHFTLGMISYKIAYLLVMRSDTDQPDNEIQSMIIKKENLLKALIKG